MEREKIYRTLIKCYEKNEQKFCEFKQLIPVGKRIVYKVLNFALGETDSFHELLKYVLLKTFQKLNDK